MYSGSTLHNYSGALLGAHQKINRVSHRHLLRLSPLDAFPSKKLILHFEGKNGPDGIKRKSPAMDEPWHYLQPFDAADTELIELLETHYELLVKSLRRDDLVRAAFEAAWLSHAVVDGLTPAHHYPYEEKLVELSSGRSIDARTSVAKKLIMPGPDPRQQLRNNWKMWGPKGLFTTHAAFEMGVAMLIAPLSLRQGTPTSEEISEFAGLRPGTWFRRRAQQVADLGLYDEFYESGWTMALGRKIRLQLAPSLVNAVTVIWHGAINDAAQPVGSRAAAAIAA